MKHDGVQATLPDGIPRWEALLPGTALAERERMMALVHALTTETANELMILRQAPFLAAAFTKIECGVTIADPNLEDTPLVYANAAYERMTGYPRAELLGRNCRFLQGDLRDQPNLRIIRNALAPGTDCTVELTNCRSNGEPFQNRLKLRAIRTPDGSLSHIIGIQLDIAKEHSALESLARQKRRYESLVEAQSGYIWLMEVERATYQDRLTGILSTEGFAQRLNERLSERSLHPASPVVVVDIKALREINNSQGYGVGDDVLREVARRLTAEASLWLQSSIYPSKSEHLLSTSRPHSAMRGFEAVEAMPES